MHRHVGQVLGDGFIPRMNGRSRPGIMRALGPSDLFTHEASPVRSVVVDARLASEDRDITAELHEQGIVMIVDTQAWRYSDPRTWKTAWGSTSYVPEGPFRAQQNWIHDYVSRDLAFQLEMGASCFLLPGWFPSLESVERAHEVAVWTLEAYGEFAPRTELRLAISWLPTNPGPRDATLAAAKVYAESGMVHAFYIQRNKINGVRDSLDQLKHCAKLMLEIQNLGLPVIAGHLGCIGFTMRAIGVSAADCGPCEGQSFDFSGAIRTTLPHMSDNERSRPRPVPVRMWLDELGQTVTARQMTAIRQNRAAFAEVMCRRACHRFRLGRDSMTVAVHHSLLSLCETAARQSLVPPSMRVDHARRLLMEMKTRIGVIESALGTEKQPLLYLDHLDTQLALLADVEGLHGVA